MPLPPLQLNLGIMLICRARNDREVDNYIFESRSGTETRRSALSTPDNHLFRYRGNEFQA